MIIYGSTISPFVRKVVAFAAEKGIAIELKPSGMGRGGPDFEEASPFRKMPAMRDPGADGGRDFTISDSTAIVTYLEAKHPEPNLIPLNPTPGWPSMPSTRRRIDGFVRVLEAGGVNVTVRDTRGRGIDAACGQLRSEHGRATIVAMTEVEAAMSTASRLSSARSTSRLNRAPPSGTL